MATKTKRYTARTGFPTFRKRDADYFSGVGVWNLFRDGVTPTFIESFITCREQTRLAYVLGWQGKSNPMSIEFGNCIHWILEEAYAAPEELPDKENCDYLVQSYTEFWKENNPSPSEQAIEQQNLVYGFAAATLPAYFRRWSGDFTGTYGEMPNVTPHPRKWLALEGELDVPYVYPDGLVVRLRGKRDAVFLDKEVKRRVLDTKCLSVVNDSEMMDTFPIDFQQNYYLWCDLQEHGNVAGGAIKNIYRRPGQRRKVNENLHDYFARIAAEAGDPKQWDTKGKDTVGWFVRYNLSVVESEIREWKRTRLDPIMQDIRDWVEGKRSHYPSDKFAVGKYGRCNLFGALVEKDFTNCFKRTKPFPELA